MKQDLCTLNYYWMHTEEVELTFRGFGMMVVEVEALFGCVGQVWHILPPEPNTAGGDGACGLYQWI